MRISLRLYKGMVLIPTAYRVQPDGFHVTNRPLDFVPAEDTKKLQQAILAAIERGNPPISRDGVGSLLDSGDDPHLETTGARSWFVLDRQTKGLWAIVEKDGHYEIRVDQPMETHGWHEDKSKRIQFPPETSIEDVIDRVIAMIQACARQ